ncbi:neuroblast differentiation-associated protein AHNAK [Xyrichtys novacula]|uniref:Neuroblast differentiation-associated protein AHNAK n=1 Tax=Xyrichtys novacula TaxID=13765 RepID=A0AAV1FZZ3_XYRNO|nr:neuroblast differentiation-associated protein AHNAK [Xyrichtys novacula]
MSGERNRGISESLVLDDAEGGVVIAGITDDNIAAKSGLQAGDEIVAATIHLDHLNKNEVLNILKVLEPYDNNMKVVTKKEFNASAGLGSLGLDLKEPAEMLGLKKDLPLDTQTKAPVVSLNGLDGNIATGQGLGGEISGPALNGDLPSLNLNNSSADTGASFALPSLAVNGPDVKGDLDGTLKAPRVSVSTPQLNTSSVDIAKPEIKTGDNKFKAPKFSMPVFNASKTSSLKADTDLNTSGLSVSGPELPELGLKNPDVKLETQNVDFEAPSGKRKWLHTWKGPKIKGPNADLQSSDVNLSTPKIDGDLKAPNVDINLPKANIEGPDVDVKGPNLDTGHTHGKFHLPWKMKKAKLQTPKADLDIDPNLNTPELDVCVPKVEGEINAPNVDLKGPHLDMQAPNIDAESPSGKWDWLPWNWKKPKVHGPDVDINAEKPDLNLSSPKIDGEINGPELKGHDLDIDGPNLEPSVRFPWFQKKWKKPRLHGPKADLNADLSAHDCDLKVNGPDGNLPNVDIEVPDADVETPSGKLKFPTLRKSKFMFSGPKVNSPDVDMNCDAKGPDLSLPTPIVDVPGVDVKAPNAEIEAPSGKFKISTLKKPKWSLSGPKVDGPDVNLDASGSTPDMSFKAPKIDGEVEAPDAGLDINAPDVEGPFGKFKGFKLPKIGTLRGPKANADVAAPKLDVKTPDVELPDANIRGPNVDVDGPNLSLDSPESKLKLPKIKLPKFMGAKIKGPDVDTEIDAPNIGLPKADIDAPRHGIELNPSDLSLSGPKVKGGIDTPDLEVSGKKPGFKLPSWSIGGPKAQLPDAELNTPDLAVPGVETPGLNFSAPTIKGEIGTLNTDLNPNVDLKAPKSDYSLPKIDLNLPKAGVKSPSLDLPTADLKAPDAQLKTPDLDVDSSLGDFKFPHFKLPKFGSPDPKVEVPSVNAEVNAPQVNIAAPTADTSISIPAVDISGPKVDADIGGPTVDLKAPNVDANMEKSKLPHFKFPKFNLSGSSVKAADVDTAVDLEVSPDVTLNAPNVDGEIRPPGVDISGPSLGVSADADAELKGSSKSKGIWPFKWGRKSVSGAEEGIEVKSETDGPNVGSGVPAFKFHKLPRNSSIDGSVDGDDTLGLPNLDTEEKDYVISKGVRLPIVNTTSKTGEKVDVFERLKMAMEKVSSASTSPTDSKGEIDLKLPSAGLDVGTSVGEADSSLVRGSTFKIEKPDPILSVVAPGISTPDENDKLSLSLTNMLGLNIKDSDGD